MTGEAVTLSQDRTVEVVGVAACAEEGCAWEVLDAVPLARLAAEMGIHTKDTQHAKFIRTASDVVKVEIRKVR
ncbi:hypothetical protein [Kitasatospora sp. NPDC087315]|uniref:hypothetical protein n=1 Tax=Kitasatospora sp. NPDC087315 TaxID=3364069 RepID=UPI003822F31A